MYALSLIRSSPDSTDLSLAPQINWEARLRWYSFRHHVVLPVFEARTRQQAASRLADGMARASVDTPSLHMDAPAREVFDHAALQTRRVLEDDAVVALKDRWRPRIDVLSGLQLYDAAETLRTAFAERAAPVAIGARHQVLWGATLEWFVATDTLLTLCACALSARYTVRSPTVLDWLCSEFQCAVTTWHARQLDLFDALDPSFLKREPAPPDLAETEEDVPDWITELRQRRREHVAELLAANG